MSALGVGLDYGQVRLVIHPGHGGNLMDFAQESGRGGRDGKPADSITMFWEGLQRETGWMTDERIKEMMEWINSKGCRKKSLSVYLHGSGEDCLSQGGGEICDICEKILKEKLEWSVLGKR